MFRKQNAEVQMELKSTEGTRDMLLSDALNRPCSKIKNTMFELHLETTEYLESHHLEARMIR